MSTSVEPSSSPRLPSPPPIAEIQLGPQSPTIDDKRFAHIMDLGSARRIRPGTKAAEMAEGPPLVDLSEIDSAFQLTEHLKALHHHLTHPDPSHTVPIDREKAHRLAHPPEGVDKGVWLYELCRFLTQKVNMIIVGLFSDHPPCSADTCPEMRASEWQYLCAVHEPPKSCCAIDYCCHTLDWAANTLTSTKHFPSRLSLGSDPEAAEGQVRTLTNVFRRVYRIFAHAWFQHREMFWRIENQTGLYVFFKMVCDLYSLIQDENYTIPREAEGTVMKKEPSRFAPPVIIKRTTAMEPERAAEKTGDHIISAGSTTKRHRTSPSVGGTVTTVVEEQEEEEEQEKQKLKEESMPQPAQESPAEQEPENNDATIVKDEKEESLSLVEPATEVSEQIQGPELAHDAHDSSDGEPGVMTPDTEEFEDKPVGEEAVIVDAGDAATGGTEEAKDVSESATDKEEGTGNKDPGEAAGETEKAASTTVAEKEE